MHFDSLGKHSTARLSDNKELPKEGRNFLLGGNKRQSVEMKGVKSAGNSVSPVGRVDYIGFNPTTPLRGIWCGQNLVQISTCIEHSSSLNSQSLISFFFSDFNQGWRVPIKKRNIK